MASKAKAAVAAKTLLASLGVILAITGCSGAAGDSNGNQSPNNDKEANAESPVLTNPKDFKFDPPIKVTTGYRWTAQGENEFKEGETIEDNFHTRWMRESMGIDLSFDFVTPNLEDYQTKLRLMMAGNQKLPDVFTSKVEMASDLITAGKVQPLNDYIDKYLSDNVKAIYEKYPDVLYPVTRDGKIFGLPNLYAMDEGTVMWVREDWLQKLKLEAPKTIDEFTEVIRAFTEEDPDGNGVKDTLGLAISLKEGPYNWMSSGDGLVGAFGNAMPSKYIWEYWNPDESGQLIYNGIQPSVKSFLAQMREWHEKGYVDPEAGIKDPGKAGEMASSGQAGIIFGPAWMNGYPLSGVPGFKAYPLPAGADGQQARAEKTMVRDYLLFNKDFKNVDAIIGYINKIYAASFGESDPYFDEALRSGWMEGYDYVTHEGKVYRNNFGEHDVPKEKWPNASDDTITYGLSLPFLNGTVPFQSDTAFEKFLNDPDAEPSNITEISVSKADPRMLEAGLVRISQNESTVVNYFSAAPTKTMISKGELLNKLTNETYLKIIYGNEPVDYFDEFVEQWKKNGGDEITKEVNEWYASVKK
ncbi:extracellular solute-binding protein [Paenibacillus sp. LPE1-1-1.1]|uniref:extracellular solute-binding protein n=1 Tax=Paenibacillus sp. LPE1-1-1.1 TaxID=3135230 RepID=UPI00342BA53E